MNAARLKAERLVYSVMDALDPSGANTDFWKEQFASMSDAQFKNYISNDFPFVVPHYLLHQYRSLLRR